MMKNNNWKIWGKKLLKNCVYVALAGIASVYSENPYWLAIAPLAMSLENLIRHW